MIRHSFGHIDGISASFEQEIYDKGIKHWDEFLMKSHLFTELPKAKLERIQTSIEESKAAHARSDLQYFKHIVKPKEHWRLCHMGKIGYVDIETTGLSRSSSEITVIGIYDGLVPHLYVNGKNLDAAKEKMHEFDIIVTFNGKQFDMPFIEHYFSYNFDLIHLDLRYMLKELGLTGGLKNIEHQLGISRGDLEGVDGFEAVRLWNQYKRGNQQALHRLLRYNEQDIVNLKSLLDHYLEKKQLHAVC